MTMDTIGTQMRPGEAYRELVRFAAKCGAGSLQLALHAAVPQGLRADLLHLLRVNFVPEARNTASEADVLLSRLVDDLGGGYFQLDSEVRRLLLDTLVQQHGFERLQRVANFLLQYLEHWERSSLGGQDRLWRDYLETQRWVAYAFVKPDAAAEQFAAALHNAVGDDQAAVRMQLGGLAPVLSTPLARYRKLLTYAVGLQALQTGQVDQARTLLQSLGAEALTIGATTLRPASDVLGEWVPTPEPSPTPGIFSQGYALIVGSGDYQYHPGLNIPVAARDAEALWQTLISPQFCGYHPSNVVTLIREDATRDAVLNALYNLASMVDEQSTVLIYLSGHSIHQNSDYLFLFHDTKFKPSGSSEVDPASCITSRDLLQAIKVLPARRVLLMFNTGTGVPIETVSALLATGEGRVVFTACREDQHSYFQEGNTFSFFTQALLEGLRGEGVRNHSGYISAFNLYDYVFTRVSAELREQRDEDNLQEPELTILKGTDTFGIGLYRGGITSDVAADTNQPRAQTTVNVVSPDESGMQLEQLLGTNTEADAQPASASESPYEDAVEQMDTEGPNASSPAPTDNFLYIGRGLTADEFSAYVTHYDFGRVPPDYIVLHSTTNPGTLATRSPASSAWDANEEGLPLEQIYRKRQQQLERLKEQFRVRQGWDRGAHLFIDERWIWLFTPMSEIGIHVAQGNSQHDSSGLHYSIGIEVIGEYDRVVWPEPVAGLVGHAVAVLQQRLGTFELRHQAGPGGISSHRDYDRKRNCPGAAITEQFYLQVIREAARRLANAEPGPTVPSQHPPFVVDRPLRADEAIFGRETILQKIISQLTYSMSINIIGERRMGKTTLLNHLFARLEQADSRGQGPSLLRARIDPQLGIADPQTFFGLAMRDLLQDLVRLTGTEAISNLTDLRKQLAIKPVLDFNTFTETLSFLVTQLKLRPILIVDEFEYLLQEKSFGPEFFMRLRGLSSTDLLTLVVSSRLTLSDPINDRAMFEANNSPVANYSMPFVLQPLDLKSARALLSQPSDHPLSSEEIELALRWGEGNPCLLQAAGYALYQASSQGESITWAEQRFNEIRRSSCMG